MPKKNVRQKVKSVNDMLNTEEAMLQFIDQCIDLNLADGNFCPMKFTALKSGLQCLIAERDSYKERYDTLYSDIMRLYKRFGYQTK